MVPEACRIFVYDKGGSNGEEDSPLSQRCQLPPMANMQCETLPNRGREFGSYIHYILENYDALPERIIFAPSNFGKHDREDGIRQLLEATVGHPSSVDDDAPTQTEMQSFWCMEHRSTCEGNTRVTNPSRPLREFLSFRGDLESLNGHTVNSKYIVAAWPEELGAWLDVHLQSSRAAVGPNASTLARRCDALRACNYGQFATTRENVLAYPRQVYKHLHALLDHRDANAAYLVEKAAALLFGRRRVDEICADSLRDTA